MTTEGDDNKLSLIVEHEVTELMEIVEDYSGAKLEFTQETEIHPLGYEETILYIELGQSLDVFGLDDVFYDVDQKKYFIFFSTFLLHLGKASKQTYGPIFTLTYTQVNRGRVSLELV